jgi:drug/metabolite transporter (DMT)-like permease
VRISGPAVLRGAALVVVWSSGFIAADFGAHAADPDTLLAWRCLATAVLLLPWSVRALTRFDRREWARQAVLAVLCQCLYIGGVFWASAAGVPAGTTALIASLQPAVVLVAATGRTPRPAHLAGLVLGTLGVAVTAAGDVAGGLTAAALLLPLLSMASLAAGTLLQQRWTSGAPLTSTLAVQSLVTTAFFAALAAADGALAPPATPIFWLAVAVTAAAGLGGYGVYYAVTTRDGAARASTLLYLTPAATAVWAALMLGRPLVAATVAGLLISGAAVALLRTAGTTPDVTDGAPRRDTPPTYPAAGASALP